MCNQARMRIITVLLVLVLHVELALGDDAAVLDNDQLLSALGIPSNALDHVSLSRRPFNALVEPEVPVYTFTKFQSSKKNDHRVRQLETICTTECGSEATEECVRRCMCAPCYDELYASDPVKRDNHTPFTMVHNGWYLFSLCFTRVASCSWKPASWMSGCRAFARAFS
ncbi:hypothetical protein, variant [Capsaspora owczarzaki ATCC 30864]|uniref:Uncharacterized protein n=1 Tax=Capsaspora owczarzaki (strain ATCC 30864) TaxID=595528 RepID=A0A0D2VXW9_CAPO3|nr:hypothetical protein, variant [Capsaspora owczarzaki ATCC 30864]